MAKVTPDNAMVWFEIPVTDMKRSKAFYDAVLLTDLRMEEGGPNPMAMFPVTEPGTGRAGHLYPGRPAAAGAGNTIHLAAPEPLEEAVARVTENGGKVVSPIITIPAGRFAYCEDPDGNSIGLFAA
jgi:predicted enzyme related to lactoylglutathione lyase